MYYVVYYCFILHSTYHHISKLNRERFIDMDSGHYYGNAPNKSIAMQAIWYFDEAQCQNCILFRAGSGPNPTRNLTRGSHVFKNPNRTGSLFGEPEVTREVIYFWPEQSKLSKNVGKHGQTHENPTKNLISWIIRPKKSN